MAVGENPKESKPQAGTTRSQDVNRRDPQKSPGTSTTPSRPNPGGVQDTEMVRLGLGRSRRGGEPWRVPSETDPLGLEKSLMWILGAWLGEASRRCSGAVASSRALAADIWTQCCSNSRPRSSEGPTPSTCLIVTTGASIGSGR